MAIITTGCVVRIYRYEFHFNRNKHLNEIAHSFIHEMEFTYNFSLFLALHTNSPSCMCERMERNRTKRSRDSQGSNWYILLNSPVGWDKPSSSVSTFLFVARNLSESSASRRETIIFIIIIGARRAWHLKLSNLQSTTNNKYQVINSFIVAPRNFRFLVSFV